MIQDYLRAGYPGLAVLTYEPQRAEITLKPQSHWKSYSWDCQRGFREAGSQQVFNDKTDPLEAAVFLNNKQNTVVFAHNLHLFFDEPVMVQAISNGIERWKSLGNCLVVLAPQISLPAELEKCFALIDFPLPDPEDLYAIQEDIAKDMDIQPDQHTAHLARGLTGLEAEAAFALSLVKDKQFTAESINRVKAQTLKKSGLLEYWQPEDIQNVGGLDQLKDFISRRIEAISNPDSGLPRMRGILLAGVPGTGKSLTSKAVASVLNWPLLKLDIGALKGSLVGESEKKIRQATKTIDAFGNCVVWIDEIEKGFAGASSRNPGDSGATSGMLSHWLTWLQETRSPVLLMATANDVTALPPEFLRSGRFDALFFVDLPSPFERRDIVRIMNKKYNTDIPEEYADTKLEGYTGAEIEQIAKDSLFDGLDEAIKCVTPISRTMPEQISALRKWGATRARLANTRDSTTNNQARRVNPVLLN